MGREKSTTGQKCDVLSKIILVDLVLFFFTIESGGWKRVEGEKVIFRAIVLETLDDPCRPSKSITRCGWLVSWLVGQHGAYSLCVQSAD